MEFNAKTAREIVEHHIDMVNPVMLWGAPGIGKSDIVRQIAKSRGWNVLDLRATTIDPVDLRGLPSVHGDEMVFVPTGLLPTEKKHGAHGILFLDELPQGPMAVQNGFMELSLDRKSGDYELPAGWHVVAAGNRMEDKAGTNRLNAALANRFAHVDMCVSVDDWSQWAIAQGDIPAEIVAFIRFRPELLHSFNPDRKVNATPRTWSMAAKSIRAGMPAHLEFPLLASTIGEGPATELLAFLRIWRNLPNPDAVLMNPDVAEIPTDGATLYALCGALARKVTARTVGNFCAYASRLPSEFGVLLIKDATRRDPSLAKTPEMVTFMAMNSEVYL